MNDYIAGAIAGKPDFLFPFLVEKMLSILNCLKIHVLFLRKVKSISSTQFTKIVTVGSKWGNF